MRVFFYHTEDVQMMCEAWAQGAFPGHLLYGATHLADHGIEVMWHQPLLHAPRWRMMLHTAWDAIRHLGSYDAIYATQYRGIELLVLLRAMRLLRKPIVIWHHQPVIVSHAWWREHLGRFFYRGFDAMFFFSQKLYDDSLGVPKAAGCRMVVGHWGADLDYYDRVMQSPVQRQGFISTGKERRDMGTLVAAFNATGAPLQIYVASRYLEHDYEQMFGAMTVAPNVKVNFVQGFQPVELSRRVNAAACVVICCLETRYTVGLTTLVEALALGLPVICSRNPQFPIDVDREQCGISVPYGDVEGWMKAISYIGSHPDEARQMGHRARALAERMYNDKTCAREVAQVIYDVVDGRHTV